MYPAVTLEQILTSQSAKETTANANFDALSAGALFGVKSLSGFALTLYGGNLNVSGTPTAIANQSVTLTANATNYLYSTSAGVLTKTTSIPSGWPGPLAASAVALYSMVTNSSAVTSATSYLVGSGAPGATGAAGIQGNPGSDFAATRKHIWQSCGGGSTVVATLGFANFTVVGTATARSLGTSNLRDSIPYLSYQSAGTSGASAQINPPQDSFYFGNASGRGGFTVAIRFALESAQSPATFRCFAGISTGGAIGNVEPDTLLNIIGIASKAGDANLSVIHNDGSGTATMATLGANFPARSSDAVYELLLESVANSSTVTYTLTNKDTGNTTSNSISSDVPANTVFMRPCLWCNNGSTASAASFGIMQIIAETRY